MGTRAREGGKRDSPRVLACEDRSLQSHSKRRSDLSERDSSVAPRWWETWLPLDSPHCIRMSHGVCCVRCEV
jgi:hypothetical protein